MKTIGFERFTAVSDDVANKVVAQACGNRHMSIPWRLWEITLCRINNWGHAPFDVDELTMMVCGAVGSSERKALNRGFKTLIELERIAPESSRLCVVANDDWWRRGAGKGSWEDTCSEPSHRQHRRHVWSATRGWVAHQREASIKTAGVTQLAPGAPEWPLVADPWEATG